MITCTPPLVAHALPCRVCGRMVPVLAMAADVEHKIVTFTYCRDCPRPKRRRRECR